MTLTYELTTDDARRMYKNIARGWPDYRELTDAELESALVTAFDAMVADAWEYAKNDLHAAFAFALAYATRNLVRPPV